MCVINSSIKYVMNIDRYIGYLMYMFFEATQTNTSTHISLNNVTYKKVLGWFYLLKEIEPTNPVDFFGQNSNQTFKINQLKINRSSSINFVLKNFGKN